MATMDAGDHDESVGEDCDESILKRLYPDDTLDDEEVEHR